MQTEPNVEVTSASRLGRLTARPHLPSESGSFGKGVHRLKPGPRGGRMLVPQSYDPERAAPLLVFLHGAGGDSQQGLDLFSRSAEELGAILLLPESAASTWDVILDDYGPDVVSIDQALELGFRSFSIDPRRLAVGGFADGASYAVSLALTNGDLFTHVLAFTPGFSALREVHGASRFFLAHGSRDPVLPVRRCSRVIVRRLEQSGYEVHYLEFNGGHAVPPEVLTAATRWFEGA
ncbi:MAG: hypothetical protein H6Q89_1286 [Myxococcaceae bacterium]|nr:hypothetical protein [Myxococcaceae bacterium]